MQTTALLLRPAQPSSKRIGRPTKPQQDGSPLTSITRQQASRFVMEAIDTIMEKNGPCTVVWTGHGLKVSRLSKNATNQARPLRNRQCLGVFDFGVDFKHLLDELSGVITITE